MLNRLFVVMVVVMAWACDPGPLPEEGAQGGGSAAGGGEASEPGGGAGGGLEEGAGGGEGVAGGGEASEGGGGEVTMGGGPASDGGGSASVGGGAAGGGMTAPKRTTVCTTSPTITKPGNVLPASTRVPALPFQPLTFQVLGDVHIHASDMRSFTNFNKALDDLRAIGPSAQALILNGDLTERGTQGEYNSLKSLLAGRAHAPAIWVMGNHDYHGADSSAVELQRFLTNSGNPKVYFERTIAGYPFLFLGGEHGDADLPKLAWTAVLSDAQLTWLDTRLSALAGDDHPSFVFLHQPTSNTNAQARLEGILAKHPNVVFFWSHWHRDLRVAPSEPNQFTTSKGYLSVHTGACQYSHSPSGLRYDWTQGLQVEVTASKVNIKGRDFGAKAWLGQFTFAVDRDDNPDADGISLDFDGDGSVDQLGQWTSGKLTAYLGTKQADVGTDFQNLVQVVLTDADGDGKPDVVGTRVNGALVAFLNQSTPGTPKLGPAVQLGTGWNQVTRLSVTDFDGDGVDDLLATRVDGTLSAHFGCGTPGTAGYCCTANVGTGFQNVKRLRTFDADGDGLNDVVGQFVDGRLTAFLNAGDTMAPRFAGQKDVGQGFHLLTRLSAFDADHDGKVDLVGRTKAGALQAWLNQGKPGVPLFSAPVGVGTGWNGISRVVIEGRAGQHPQHLVCRKSDGTLSRFLNQGTPAKPLLSAPTAFGTGWQLISRVVVQ